MLIGVLVEVVNAVSAGEKEKAIISSVSDKLNDVFKEIDLDCSGLISKYEFSEMIANQEVRKSLESLGVKPKHLMLLSDALFEVDDLEDGQQQQWQGGEGGEQIQFDADGEGAKLKEVTFMEFLKFVIQTRPQNPASVLDVNQLRRFFVKTFEHLMRNIDKKCSSPARRAEIMSGKLQNLRFELARLVLDIEKRQNDINGLNKEAAIMEAEEMAEVGVPMTQTAPAALATAEA